MNLLLINYEYPPTGGGAATATAQLAKALFELGCRVTVLTGAFGSRRGVEDDHGVEVRRLSVARRRLDQSGILEMACYVARALLALPNVLRDVDPDGCIVFFSVPCGPIGWWAQWRGGVPYVVSLRGGDVPGTERGMNLIHRCLQPIRRIILRDALAVVANSEGLRALSVRADPAPVCVIPNGVDCEFFKPMDVQKQDPLAPFCFLFVGRLNDQKNVALLLDVFSNIVKMEGNCVHLRIVGDGPLKDALQEQSTRAGLGDCVEWLAWQARDTMPEIYCAADCLVNPSYYEGMPNVVLEAMACGLPVVASAVAGNCDVVRDGENGLLFPSDDRKALQAALLSMLRNRAYASKLGGQARLDVAGSYSWSAAAKAYLAFFKIQG